MPDGLPSMVIAVASLIGVAVGRWPGLRMNRATIAFVGAVGVVVSGGLTLDDALAAIDLNTLALLLAMMVLNANLRIAGVFDLMTARFSASGGSATTLLVMTILVAGFGSALLLNDTVVLVMTPLVLDVCLASGRRPVPYLVALATAANVGSAATVIGNPQNILIGSAGDLSFLQFASTLAPVAMIGLAVIALIVAISFRKDIFTPAATVVPTSDRPNQRGTSPRRARRALRWKCGASIGCMVVAMVAGTPVTTAAVGAAALLLITRRVRPERVFREVDFSLLVFFAGLFIITRGFEQTVAARAFFSTTAPLAHDGTGGLIVVGALLSNIVSNVPAVLLMQPIMTAMNNPEHAWLTLAVATTFAGNLTLLGSVANLIVAESARRRGVELSFGAYARAGVPITVCTLTLAWLWLR